MSNAVALSRAGGFRPRVIHQRRERHGAVALELESHEGVCVSGFPTPSGARFFALELGASGDARSHLNPIKEIPVVQGSRASGVKRDSA